MSSFEPLRQLALRLSNYSPWEVAVEFLIIWCGVFVIWRFVQGTRAAGAIKGILVLVVLAIALRLFVPDDSFQRLGFLFRNFVGFAAIALVIIFQPELRRALVRIGEAPFFRPTAPDVSRVVESIVAACGFLSKNKFGAIIAIERQVGLRETVESGRILNADVSAELLQSIFWPNNPLHDMGVVIRGSKIVAAGVQFPLADPQDMSDPRIGTRHRAAIGLSRVVDALVIVVSEETGAISLAERGRLERWLTPEALRAELTRRLTTDLQQRQAQASGDDETAMSDDVEGAAADRRRAPGGEAA